MRTLPSEITAATAPSAGQQTPAATTPAPDPEEKICRKEDPTSRLKVCKTRKEWEDDKKKGLAAKWSSFDLLVVLIGSGFGAGVLALWVLDTGWIADQFDVRRETLSRRFAAGGAP